MRIRITAILAGVLICLAPAASWADLAPYSQDFEGLTVAPQPEDPFESSLADDGWLFFGNVFRPDGSYWFGYGVFDAPNHGEAICAVVTDEGGPDQGFQQLDVFSDYRNGLHAAGAFIETNVFQEQVIGAGDIGSTWLFEFDAKRGNIGGGTTAVAFFKTLHPTEFWLSRFITIDMTSVPDTWESYSLSIPIDPDLEGHLLQFGFLNTATLYEGSGVYYDNVTFDIAPIVVDLDIKPGSFPNSVNPYSRGVVPVAILGSATFDVTDVDVTTLSFGPDAAAPAHNLTDSFTYNDHLRDVNYDGFADLVSHYWTRETGIACGDESATLTGATLDGLPIEGTDAIVTVGCRATRWPSIWTKDQNRPEMPRRNGPVNVQQN